MSFKFALKQRVNLPALDGVQGIVTARTDYVAGDNYYRAVFMTEAGQERCGWHLERELLQANPPPTKRKPADLAKKLKRKR